MEVSKLEDDEKEVSFFAIKMKGSFIINVMSTLLGQFSQPPQHAAMLLFYMKEATMSEAF